MSAPSLSETLREIQLSYAFMMTALRTLALSAALSTGCAGAQSAATASPAQSPAQTADEPASAQPVSQGDLAQPAEAPRRAPPAQLRPLSPFAVASLEAHNRVRAGVQPAASPALERLAWDDNLARVAQQWAQGCPSGHRPGGRFGENIYWSGGVQATADMAVNSWAAEAQHYNYQTMRCARGAQASWSICGHYTQLVWRGTQRVGCGIRTDCPGTFSSVVVCNYDPPGNVNVSAQSIPRPY